LSASKKKPDLFLSKYMEFSPHLASLNPDILEKILLNVAENLPLNQLSFDDLGAKSRSLNDFVKILPYFTKEFKVLEKIVGYIAERDLKSIMNTLKGLNLPEETLKLIIPKMIATTKDSKQLKNIIEELLSLELKDLNFIQDSITTLSHQNPKALIGNLVSLPLPKDTLQKIIPKMIDSVTSLDSLESIAKELTALNIQNQGFIESMALAISHKNPLALKDNLKGLNLSENTLKEVLSKFLELDQVDFIESGELNKLLKDLPNLTQDPHLIENMALFAAKHDPNSLIKHLNHLNLKSAVLESIILSIISLPCNPKNGLYDTCTKIYLMVKIPTFPLDDQTKAKFCEKIVSILLENNAYYCPLLVGHLKSFNLSKETLEPLISHIIKVRINDADARWMGDKTSVEFYQRMLKELLTLDLNEAFLEKTLLTIYRQCPPQALDPSQFIDKWHLIAKASSEISIPSTETKEILIKYFLRTEIKEALSQNTNKIFKDSLFYILITLDENINISYTQKLDVLIKICNVEVDPPPSIEKLTQLLEITKNLLSYSNNFQIHFYNESIYFESIHNQTLENYKYITGKTVAEDTKINISNLPTISILDTKDLEKSTESSFNDYSSSPEEILRESSNYMKHNPHIDNKDITIYPFYPM
ncbi:MAG: hypothetical protein JSS09_04430, partial [Verrucomicrobia bacterium]|nr:hypothetical protein [Verrucomicrobiota bacterium]